MNARLISLLLLCLRFPLPAQVPASLDPPFKLPDFGITVVSPTPAFLEGLRKHYGLPAYEEDKEVKDKPMIEWHTVGGCFPGGRESYYFDPNDTTKLKTSKTGWPLPVTMSVKSPKGLKKAVDGLVLKLKKVTKSGMQRTGPIDTPIGPPDLIIITHHVMTPDRILIMRGCPPDGDPWVDVLLKIFEAVSGL